MDKRTDICLYTHTHTHRHTDTHTHAQTDIFWIFRRKECMKISVYDSLMFIFVMKKKKEIRQFQTLFIAIACN